MKADSIQPFSAFHDLNQSLLTGLVKVNEVAAKRAGEFVRLNSEIVNNSLQHTLDHLQQIRGLRTLEEAVSSQGKYLSESTRRFLEVSRQYFELTLEANSEFRGIMQENAESLNERTRSTADRKAA
jgi:phasin family protein